MSSLSEFVHAVLALPEREKAAYLFELPTADPGQHTRVHRDSVGDAISYPVRANFGLGIMYYKPKGSDHVLAFLHLPHTNLVDETGALYVELHPLAADAALGVMTAKEAVNEALGTLIATAARDGSIYLDLRKGVTMHDLLPQSLAVKLDKDHRVPDDVSWVKLSKFLARTPKAYTQLLPLAGGLESLRSLDMALDTKVYIVVEPPTSLIARVLPLVYKGVHEDLLYFHTVSDRARVIEVRTRFSTFDRLAHEDKVFILADAGGAGAAW